MNTKDEIAFIMHIVDSIGAIEKFSKKLTRSTLEKNRLKQSAIIREIEVIGEAVKNIPGRLKLAHPEIDWKSIAGTRDQLIHHYFGVDLDIVWDIVKKDIPDLKKKIILIKQSLEK